MALYSLVRPLLFRLDPERAHALSLGALRLVGAVPPIAALVRSALRLPREAAPVELFGLRFANRVGLAAGYDKDALAWRGLACLGLGHVEVGTVTPRPQPGNPRPRVFRLIEDRSLINRLGFPSRGAAYVSRRLGARRPPGLVVGVNIGKQKETPLESAIEDYELLMNVLGPRADYLAVNVSSPNTPELRTLQQRAWLAPLLARLVARRHALVTTLGRPLPLLVKVAPDLSDTELDEALDVIVASGVDGVIATNTTVARSALGSPHAGEPGGLSGGALTARARAVVRRVHQRLGQRLPIVGCGGVLRAEDALALLDAGAQLVQLYTGLVYAGPTLVRRCVRVLAAPQRGG